MKKFVTLRHVAILAGFAAVGAFYLWSALSNGPVSNLDSQFYNLQADSFLSGQLHLPLEPSSELIKLPNPYDPEANAEYRGSDQSHDLSLFNGKYYMYWGPAPALTLFIPFRALQLGSMSHEVAVALFSFVGFVFSFLLLRFLVRRYLPRTPNWLLTLGVVALAFGNMAPFLLRRPAVYETAISSGFCFLFVGLYFLLTGALADRPSRWRMAAGSLALGLAVASRPHLGLAVSLCLILLVYLIRTGKLTGWRQIVQGSSALLAPFVGMVLLLLIYNELRFDSWTEFGLQYQLAGVEIRTKSGYKLEYILPGMFYYFTAPPNYSLAFPYIHLPVPPDSYPFTLPAGYDGSEITGGLFLLFPLLLVIALIPLVFTSIRTDGRRELVAITSYIALLGIGIALALSFAVWGTTMRYEMDFAGLLVVSGLLVWFALYEILTNRRGLKMIVAAAYMALLAYGVVASVAIGITGYYNTLRTAHPGAYRTLKRLSSPIPTTIAIVTRKATISEIVQDGTLGVDTDVTAGDLGIKSASLWVARHGRNIEIVAPSKQELVLEGHYSKGPVVRKKSDVVLVVSSSDKRSERLRIKTDVTAAIPITVTRGLNVIRLRPTSSGLKSRDALQPIDRNRMVLIRDLQLAKLDAR